MHADIERRIHAVISSTKAHKDTFAVPKLAGILAEQLERLDDAAAKEDAILTFVRLAVPAICDSPIHSEALIRALYRAVLGISEQAGLNRGELLEDLLFQSLKRNVETEKTGRKKRKDVRALIMSAALEEFSEKGFHAATIDSIAERAGIGKGTVYRYFATKEALFKTIKEEIISEFVGPAREDLSREDDILKIIESVIRIYLGFFEKNSAFFKVIIQEHSDFGREFSEKFINELILGLPGLKRRCWKASRNGRLKQMNYFTVFFGIIGFLNGVIQKWLHDGAEGPLLDEIDTIKEVLFYGIVTESHSAIRPDLKVIS